MKHTGALENSPRLPSLDGWRAIAIILVMVAHFGPKGERNTDVGTQGVGIFFVLSGYLITTNLLRERELAGRIDLRSFYVRRFFRLMPCAWGYLAFLLPFRIVDFPELASCIFFFRNFLLHTRSLITVHFWSLSIEEQFYLVWPACLILLAPRRARWIAILAACGFALYRFWVFEKHSIQMPNATQFHADALLVGCAFALTPRLPRLSAPWFWICTLTLACCVHAFPFIPPLGESAMVGWMIYTTAQGQITLAQKILNWSPLRQIGLMSYSLYIWHAPFTAIRLDSPLRLTVALVGLAATVVFMHYCVEKPCIRIGHRIAGRLENERRASVGAGQS